MKNQHSINTGYIFQQLQLNWKNYDRFFLKTVVKEAFENLLIRKKILSVEFDGNNGQYLDDCADNFPEVLKFANNIEEFPFPNYFLMPQKKSTHLAIVEFNESIELTKDEYDFDLFFTLQLSITDIMEADDFLQFHLVETFNKNIQKYKKFIENICLKYKEFLQDNYQFIANRFFESFANKKKTDNLKINDTTINSQNDLETPIQHNNNEVIKEDKIEQQKVAKDRMNSLEASQYLDVEINTIYGYTSGQKIPFYKPNNKNLYFLKKELDEWIMNGRKLTKEQVIAMDFEILKSKKKDKKR